MSYKAFKVEEIDNGQIIKVTISRPKSLNAMNPVFFQEIGIIFNQINKKDDVRAVILVGDGRVFTAGLDLKEYAELFSFDLDSMQPARAGRLLYETIRNLQKSFLTISDCRVPVLLGTHSLCIGGGIDLACMADIRYSTKDCKFTIKEIDIGMAADIGTLQIMPIITGNHSAFRELAYTGRFFDGDQAKEIGFVSKVFENKEKLDAGLLETARIIAAKSPIGIYTLKLINRRQLNQKVQQGLEYMARVNTSSLLTKDTMIAISAFLNKEKPVFPKL